MVASFRYVAQKGGIVAEQEGLDIEGLIRLIPSEPLQTNYFFHQAMVTEKNTGEQQRVVALSFLTAQGVSKFWFGGQQLAMFAARCAAEAQAAQKPIIATARMVPPGDERQAADDARQAAEDILNRRR